VDVRTLREGEQDALLGLLDGWTMPDALEGRPFFARYVEGDPDFRPRDVWVGEADGRLVSCVQIFPRVLRVRGREVPTGGIGTVFTRPAARGRGAAGRVLAAAMEDLRGRGLELGLLFAGPVGFYAARGWHPWPLRRPLLRATAGARPARGEPFDAVRDLDDVASLHARYCASREGVCVRTPRAWRTSLANAGNPDEEFRVARTGRRVAAYLRAVCLSRFLLLMEWGREADDAAAHALAGLFAEALAPRPDDPLAPPERPSPEFRGVAAADPLHDAALEAALRARGIGIAPADDGRTMLWAPRPEALAARLGERLRSGESGADLLRRVLPPARFGFWQADRF